MICQCRNCPKTYEESKSRADFTGYCSQKCMKEKAKKLGWDGKNLTHADMLKGKKGISHFLRGHMGSIPIKPPKGKKKTVRIMMTLTVQKVIEAEDNKAYEKRRNDILKAFDDRGWTADLTSEDPTSQDET